MNYEKLKEEINAHLTLTAREKNYLKDLIEKDEKEKEESAPTPQEAVPQEVIVEVELEDEVEESELAVVRMEEPLNQESEVPEKEEKEEEKSGGLNRKPYSTLTLKEKIESIKGIEKVAINWGKLNDFKDGKVIVANSKESGKYLIANYKNNTITSLHIDGELVKSALSSFSLNGLSEEHLINALEILANKPDYANKNFNIF